MKHKCKWYNVCPMKAFFESGKLDGRWVEAYCHRGNPHCVRYMMAERRQWHPDSMLPDGSIDEILKR